MHAAEQQDPDHFACSVHEPCDAGAPSSCPHEPTRLRRAELKRGAWSPLVLRHELGGLRHYLDGKPVHCGAGLELQHTDTKSDDYGDFTVPIQAGTVVRYEASLCGRAEDAVVTLYADIGGHDFTAPGEPWMRFRWPRRVSR